MKKLEDIPKKNPFDVPDGYFDRLPVVIQARITGPDTVRGWFPSWPLSVRNTVAAVLVLVAGIVFYVGGSQSAAEKIKAELASVSADQLVEYLDEHEVTTDDLVDKIAWSSEDLDDLENTVYSGLDVQGQEIEKVLNEYDAEL